jgi:hypothetical protein
MAGDGMNDVLDMSMFNFDPPVKQEEQSKEETKVETVETVNTSKVVKDTIKEIINKVDDESQEVVDNPEEEKTAEDKVTTSESPATDDVFGPLADFLKEQGFFPNLDKEIKTAEDLAEAFKEQIKEQEYAGLNEVQKQYLEALSQGVSEELFMGHLQNNKVFSDITDEILQEDEEIRKQVIIQDLIYSGLSPERAEKQYQRIYDIGDSVEEAKTARENLVKKENEEYLRNVESEKQQKILAEKQANEQLDKLRDNVYKQTSLFDSFKVTDQLKNKVYESMTKVVGYDVNKQPLNTVMKHRAEDPIGFDTALYYLYNLTEGFKNINKFINKATTNATKKLTDAVNRTTLVKSAGDSNYGYTSNVQTPITDLID